MFSLRKRNMRLACVALGCLAIVIAVGGAFAGGASTRPTLGEAEAGAVDPVPASQAVGIFGAHAASGGVADPLALSGLAVMTAPQPNVNPALLPGALESQTAVSALAGAGSQAWTITLAATTNNAVCDIVTSPSTGTTAGGGCTRQLSSAAPVSYSIMTEGDTSSNRETMLAGIVSSSVKSVSVTTDDGVTVPAIVQGGAMFLELPNDSDIVNTLTVGLADGATQQYAVPMVALEHKKA